MPTSVAYDPVMSRTGTTKITVPPPASTTSIAIDPKCRTIATGNQTAVPEIAQ